MKRFIVSVTIAFLMLGQFASAQAPGYDFTRTRLFSGFDGKMCKMSPSIATDWEGTILISYAHLLLTGSDVFYGQDMYKSEDNGQIWKIVRKSKSLKETWDGDLRVDYRAAAHYSRHMQKWYAICNDTKYLDDKVPFQKMVDGKPWRSPYYADIDIRTGKIGKLKNIPFPFDYAGTNAFGEPLELENGDIIITFYYVTPEQKTKNYMALCVRYRFTEDGLEMVEAGTPIQCKELKRGVYEPSITYFQGKYYMTLRSDERGMYCVSTDGLHFGPLKTWCWEDGTPIGNKNTQQHWINLGDALYLSYTRENGANNHVFRNRAPVYSARFDTEKGALIRETEFPLVPELGARLGNFHTISDGEGRAYLITAEWMQPVGCEKYGSDNSIWLISIKK